MWEFLKTKWYWVLGILVGIWVLAKLLHSGSSGGSSAPAGSSITYAGTNANDAAVQVAQLNNQSAVAQQQIAGGYAVQQAVLQEHATESTNTTAFKISQVQAANALAITNSNNAVATLASKNQTTLGIVQSNNAATVGIAQSHDQLAQAQASYAMQVVQANDALSLGVNTNATNLAALQNTNASKLAAYGIQAQVVNNQTAALQNIAIATSNNQRQVATTYLNDQTTLQSTYLHTQQSELNSVLAEVQASGGFNSQHGGANSTAAVAAVLNPASAGVASLGASGADAGIDAPQNNAAIITAIGNAVKNGLGVLFQ